MLEFAARLRDMWQSKQIRLESSIQKTTSAFSGIQQMSAVIEYCLAGFPVIIIPVIAIENLTIGQIEYKIDNTSALVYHLTYQIPLRTGDLLQIAAAMKIKSYTPKKIRYFLTNDGKILEQGAKIRQVTGNLPLSTSGMLSLLK